MKYLLLTAMATITACGQPVPDDWRDRIETDYEDDPVERYYSIIEPEGSLFMIGDAVSTSSE